MKDPNDIYREMKLLFMRLAEIDLIIESLKGEPLTYLRLKEPYIDLSDTEYAVSEQQKIYGKLAELAREYLNILRPKNNNGGAMDEKSRHIIEQIKQRIPKVSS